MFWNCNNHPIITQEIAYLILLANCNVWHPSAQGQCQDDNSIMNLIMSIVEPGRSRSAAPGLIIGLERTLTSSRWCMGRPTVYKTHAGSLGVCLGVSLQYRKCRGRLSRVNIDPFQSLQYCRDLLRSMSSAATSIQPCVTRRRSWTLKINMRSGRLVRLPRR